MSEVTLFQEASAFVAHYTANGGCGHCGGLPHSEGCFVGRIARAIANPVLTSTEEQLHLEITRLLNVNAGLCERVLQLEQERHGVLEAWANSVCVHIDRDSLVETEVVRRRQRDGSSLWRVKRLSSVLMRDGTWEVEPQPSSRDDEWIARASWPSAAEAEAAFRRHSRSPHQENG